MGEWNVDAMLDAMPLPQFYEWMAFYRLEPWDETNDWYRHGAMMALTANTTRTSKTDPVAKPQDFIPDLD